MSTAIRDWEKTFDERFVFERDNGPASAYMLFLRLPDSLKIATVDDVKAFIKEVLPVCYLTEEDDPAEHDLRKYSAVCGQCYSALAQQARYLEEELQKRYGKPTDNSKWLRELCDRISCQVPAVGDPSVTERIDWRLNAIACELEALASEVQRLREAGEAAKEAIQKLTSIALFTNSFKASSDIRVIAESALHKLTAALRVP